MSVDVHVSLVRRCYDALLCGDLSTLLDAMAEDVEFVVHGPAAVPFTGSFRGRSGVEDFFRLVAEHTARDGEQHAPEIHEVVAIGPHVFAYGRDRLRVKATGEEFGGWWVHVFQFQAGRIVRFRELFDAEAAVKTFRRIDRDASPGEVWDALLADHPHSDP